MDEYYVLVRFKVSAGSPEAARGQVKDWLVGVDKAISKYKTLDLPSGVNKVFELAQQVQKVEA